MMNVLSLSLGLPAFQGGAAPPPPGTWILAAGTWDDSGVWLDSETWID